MKLNPDNLRSWLAAIVADLRSKRVLPVVALLIAAAVAIPLLLSHSGKPASLAPLPASPTTTLAAPTATAAAVAERRHAPRQNYLTGPAHNPFVTSTTASPATGTSTAPAVSQVAATTSTGATSAPAVASPASSSNASRAKTKTGAGGTTSPRTVTVSSPTRTTTVAKTTTLPARPLPYSNYQVEVALLQAGVNSAPTVFHNLSRDQLLPGADNAFVTFLGVRTDEQTAVFVLAGGSTVTGEGNCAPSASTCTFLTLVPGQSAKIVTPSGETFTLRYAKLHKVRSSSSVVTVDPTGAADVKSAQSYVRALNSASYGRYTGLLSIELGSTVPVSR
jgi:hypothetical protein